MGNRRAVNGPILQLISDWSNRFPALFTVIRPNWLSKLGPPVRYRKKFSVNNDQTIRVLQTDVNIFGKVVVCCLIWW
ncbi:hypothetical protein GJAV_G00061110 [Gymnothorax javanicus]|nr:hypothetical protein GJAV_G00061110 [Gymnothorax javanicus]